MTTFTHVFVKIENGAVLASSELPAGESEGWVRVKLEKPFRSFMGWSIEDFECRASFWEEEQCLQSHLQCEIFDRSKFREALEMMVSDHDATIGINWDTVDYYLDHVCLIK